MPANINLNSANADYKGAVRRLDLLIANCKYQPTVRRTGDSTFLVCSHSDPFQDYKVVFFGRGQASCQCDAFKCCIHIVAAEREKTKPIQTGDETIQNIGGGEFFFACDRGDPDRGKRPAVRCACGSVATHGYRCKACHAIWQAEQSDDDGALELQRSELFG
jgi:hypothetical protein